MPIRPALLLAAALLAAPAHAQDAYAEAPQGSYQIAYEAVYDGEWDGEWADDATWHGEWSGTYSMRDARIEGADTDLIDQPRADGAIIPASRAIYADRPSGAPRLTAGPRFAYSPAQRDQWLSDCRYTMTGDGYYDDYDDRYFADDQAYAADYCADYLQRYETAGYGDTYARPTRVTRVLTRRPEIEVVREEWVEVGAGE